MDEVRLYTYLAFNETGGVTNLNYDPTTSPTALLTEFHATIWKLKPPFPVEIQALFGNIMIPIWTLRNQNSSHGHPVASGEYISQTRYYFHFEPESTTYENIQEVYYRYKAKGIYCLTEIFPVNENRNRVPEEPQLPNLFATGESLEPDSNSLSATNQMYIYEQLQMAPNNASVKNEENTLSEAPNINAPGGLRLPESVIERNLHMNYENSEAAVGYCSAEMHLQTNQEQARLNSRAPDDAHSSAPLNYNAASFDGSLPGSRNLESNSRWKPDEASWNQARLRQFSECKNTEYTPFQAIQSMEPMWPTWPYIPSRNASISENDPPTPADASGNRLPNNAEDPKNNFPRQSEKLTQKETVLEPVYNVEEIIKTWGVPLVSVPMSRPVFRDHYNDFSSNSSSSPSSTPYRYQVEIPPEECASGTSPLRGIEAFRADYNCDLDEEVLEGFHEPHVDQIIFGNCPRPFSYEPAYLPSNPPLGYDLSATEAASLAANGPESPAPELLQQQHVTQEETSGEYKSQNKVPETNVLEKVDSRAEGHNSSVQSNIDQENADELDSCTLSERLNVSGGADEKVENNEESEVVPATEGMTPDVNTIAESSSTPVLQEQRSDTSLPRANQERRKKRPKTPKHEHVPHSPIHGPRNGFPARSQRFVNRMPQASYPVRPRPPSRHPFARPHRFWFPPPSSRAASHDPSAYNDEIPPPFPFPPPGSPAWRPPYVHDVIGAQQQDDATNLLAVRPAHMHGYPPSGYTNSALFDARVRMPFPLPGNFIIQQAYINTYGYPIDNLH